MKIEEEKKEIILCIDIVTFSGISLQSPHLLVHSQINVEY